jgi:stalled ribosome rescue protein Dom34
MTSTLSFSMAIWITSSEAKVFKFLPSGVEAHHMHAHGTKHPAETQGRNRPKEGGDADKFFHEVAEYLGKEKGTRWLVMGPGVAKVQFQHHVEKHHGADAKKIVGVEAVDKGTDGELTNFAHDFFKKKGVFQ